MKKAKVLIPFLSMFALASCSLIPGFNPISSDNNFDTDPTQDVAEDGEANDHDGVYEEEAAIEPPESYDSFSGTTISSAGKYYLQGSYDKIEITASKNSVVYTFFDGVSINSSTGIAFSSSNKITLYVVLLNNSTNTIVNDYKDENAFHVKGDVHISGSGTLDITSKQNNGLKVSKDLYVNHSTVTLKVEGANHAIAARSLIAFNATISVKSLAKDGIQVECDDSETAYTTSQGFAYLVGAKITADTKGDGIQADTYVYISGGTYNITTHGEFVSYSTSNMSTYNLKTSDFKYVASGTSYKRVATDEIRNLNSSYYALTNSVKGIKVGIIEADTNDDDVDDASVIVGDYDLTIAHLASVTIDSTDDCIHANYGTVNLFNSNFNLTTLDDGAHADKDLVVNNSSIQIANSYEGLEGMNVTVDGSETNIIANSEDDGINAASDISGTNTIRIKDGYLRIYANGDGVDANTALYFTGGTTIVEGPGSGNGSLDSENVYFQGGIVFACSTSGMRERMSASQNTFLYQGNTMSSGNKISVVDSSSNALFSYTLKQSCNQLIFSHSGLQIGSTYRIVSNDSSDIGSITMTSSLTTVGNSGGGGGQPPHH